jgi:dienelactone hydrolase
MCIRIIKSLFLSILILALAACGTNGGTKSNANANSIYSKVNIEKYSANLKIIIRKPDGEGPFPAIVLMHGCSGLSPAVKTGLYQHADYFNKHGYVTLILDSFSSRGITAQKACTEHEILNKARYYRTFDAFAAHEYLTALPYVDGNIYLIGQSNGGSVALQASRKGWQETVGTSRKFSAIAAYYPWCGPIIGGKITFVSTLLILIGQKDDWTLASECTRASERLNDKMLTVIVYPNAHHSFDLSIPIQKYVGHTVGRNGPALTDSRQKILNFFQTHHLN